MYDEWYRVFGIDSPIPSREARIMPIVRLTKPIEHSNTDLRATKLEKPKPLGRRQLLKRPSQLFKVIANLRHRSALRTLCMKPKEITRIVWRLVNLSGSLEGIMQPLNMGFLLIRLDGV